MTNVKQSSLKLAFDSIKKTNTSDYLEQKGACKDVIDILGYSVFEPEFEITPYTINIFDEGEFRITKGQLEKFIINCKYHNLLKK